MAVRKRYSKFLSDGEVNQIIEDLKKREGERVFKVNIHCVGLEYRMYNPHVSLEEVVGNQYQINLKDITKEQHSRIKEVMEDMWHKSGECWEDRGLY